jgi:hypothetical protein
MKEVFELLRDIGVFGLFMWFIQLLLSKYANRQFESYKAELNKSTTEHQLILDSKLEHHKTELNIKTYKTTKIYEQQLSTIIELHKMLRVLNKEMTMMVVRLMKNITDNTKETEDEELRQFAILSTEYDKFIEYYQNNILLIPEPTTLKVDKITKEYINSIVTYIKRKGSGNEITFMQAKEIGDNLTTDLKEALDQLKNDFRKLIGVENI